MAVTYHAGRRIQGLSTDVADTPTVNDDLITDKGWETQGHVGMTYDATNDEVDFNCVADTSHDYALIDLQDADYINGSNISDTAFELKCGWRVDTISNPSANENRATIGLYANNTSNNTAQDIFTLRFSATTGGGQALEIFAKDNAIAVGGSAEYTFTETLSAQTLYLRFNRDGNNFRIRLYSDSNYTTLVEDSGNQSVSGITGLRYFGIKNRGDTQNNGGSTTGAILPNIEIYDGISSTTNKPTDVQIGSRFEETNTRKMYNFVVPSLTFEEDWTSTPSGQTIVGSQVTESSNRINFAFTLNNVANSYSLDLANVSNMGANLDDEKFVVRFKMFIQDITSNATGQFVIMLSDTANAQPAVTSQNSLGFYTDGRSSDDEIFPAEYTGTSITLGSEIESVNGTGINLTRYVEFKRESQTVFRVTFYSDSSYSTVVGSQTVTAKTTHDALRYFSIGIRQVSGKVGDFEGYIDDLKVYNGVTQTTNYWQEIGA